jgi:hypothetical protein
MPAIIRDFPKTGARPRFRENRGQTTVSSQNAGKDLRFQELSCESLAPKTLIDRQQESRPPSAISLGPRRRKAKTVVWPRFSRKRGLAPVLAPVLV